jgi:pyruvate kinase
LEAGVDVFRLNASHGTQEALAERVRIVRATASELGIHAGILLDLQGPKIRLGTFETGRLTLQTGQEFTITTEAVTGTQEQASTTYADFAADVRVGDRILLNDGAAELRALANNGTAVKCKVISGGDIGDRKGINLPGVKVSAPSLTRKDSSDLAFGLALGIDFVALSFVRTGNDVLRLKFLLEEKDAKVPVVAKIEKPEAWQNLDAIIKESAVHPKEHHPQSPRGGQVCDHRHADAGIDDPELDAHARRGFRRRQCHLRRNRCGDAFRRNGCRQVPRGSGADDGQDRGGD